MYLRRLEFCFFGPRSIGIGNVQAYGYGVDNLLSFPGGCTGVVNSEQLTYRLEVSSSLLSLVRTRFNGVGYISAHTASRHHNICPCEARMLPLVEVDI